MDTRLHSEASSSGRNELATLARLLALEREKRLTAERLLESERQALLQLKALLTGGRETSKPVEQHTRLPVSAVAERHKDDLLSTVLSQLPLDTQGLLTGAKTTHHSSLELAMAAIHTSNTRQLEEVISEELVTEHGGALLSAAVDCGNAGCVRVLLRSGCHADAPSPSGSYPLLCAASNGHIECMMELVSNGCNLSLTDDQDSTALHLALHHGRQECANKLISAGTPLTCVTKSGHTVLHAATITNMPHLLRSILAQLRAHYHPPTVHQLVNHTDNHGYTALHEAAAEGFKECVQVLCACPEIDLSIRDSTGHTAADVATADCSLVISNSGCKEAVVMIETHNGSRCAVGRLHILPTHSWQDLTNLVELAIQQYFIAIQTISRNADSSQPAASSMPGTPRPTGKVPEKLTHLLKMSASEVCDVMDEVVKERMGDMEPLTMGNSGIRQVRIGRSVCEGSNPYHALELMEQADRPLEVITKLTGVAEGVLLSFTPVSLLEQCSRLLAARQALLIHSTPSADTAPVIKQLTSYLQQEHDDSMVVVKVPLYSGFSRDSLITLLHNKKLLHPPGAAETTPTTVLVMDGMERVKDMEEVFAELFVAMETKEGVWLDGVPDYPPGEYVLSTQCRIIATHCSASIAAGTMTDHFAHVRLSDNTEPGCGLLLRQLLSKLINTRRGVLPMRFDGLYQSVVWVWRVWILYNHYMRHLGFSFLTTGHKLFLACPIESNNVDIVLCWLCELWNHSLVPKIEEGLIQVAKAHHSRRDTARHLLVFMTTRVIQLTSPLSPDATRQLVSKLHGASLTPPSPPRPSPRDSPSIPRFNVDVALLKTQRHTKSPHDRVMDDSVKFQTLPNRGLAKRTSSFSGTLKKSLFGGPKQNGHNDTVKLRASRDTIKTRDTAARMSYGGIDDLKRSNKMDQLFDMLMDAGSHRLEEQRVPFTRVPHHKLPVTSSDSSLKEPASPARRESKRVRSMSLDGSVQWTTTQTMDCGDDIFRPVSSSDQLNGVITPPVLPPHVVTSPTNSSRNQSLLYASTLGCLADSTLHAISSNQSTRSRRRASLSAAAANMCYDAVEL